MQPATKQRTLNFPDKTEGMQSRVIGITHLLITLFKLKLNLNCSDGGENQRH